MKEKRGGEGGLGERKQADVCARVCDGKRERVRRVIAWQDRKTQETLSHYKAQA